MWLTLSSKDRNVYRASLYTSSTSYPAALSSPWSKRPPNIYTLLVSPSESITSSLFRSSSDSNSLCHGRTVDHSTIPGNLNINTCTHALEPLRLDCRSVREISVWGRGCKFADNIQRQCPVTELSALRYVESAVHVMMVPP